MDSKYKRCVINLKGNGSEEIITGEPNGKQNLFWKCAGPKLMIILLTTIVIAYLSESQMRGNFLYKKRKEPKHSNSHNIMETGNRICAVDQCFLKKKEAEERLLKYTADVD